MQAVRQPVILESFDYREALIILLRSDELLLIISLALMLL